MIPFPKYSNTVDAFWPRDRAPGCDRNYRANCKNDALNGCVFITQSGYKIVGYVIIVKCGTERTKLLGCQQGSREGRDRKGKGYGEKTRAECLRVFLTIYDIHSQPRQPCHNCRHGRAVLREISPASLQNIPQWKCDARWLPKSVTTSHDLPNPSVHCFDGQGRF